MPTAKKENVTISVSKLNQKSCTLRLIGTTPLYQNRMSAKAKQEFLVGGGKGKSKAERAHIKHDPLQEFVDAAEIIPDGPTALGMKVIAVKAAMATAALETEGVYKTEIQRLLFMPGDLVPLYGTPHLKMDIVRQGGMNKTPDIRTRPYLPKWGTEIEMRYITPQLNLTSLFNILCNAGVLIGLGDYRQEKGKGNFGSFRVISADDQDAEWEDLITHHGRDAQQRALDNPMCADADTEDLMQHFNDEVMRREAA